MNNDNLYGCFFCDKKIHFINNNCGVVDGGSNGGYSEVNSDEKNTIQNKIKDRMNNIDLILKSSVKKIKRSSSSLVGGGTKRQRSSRSSSSKTNTLFILPSLYNSTNCIDSYNEFNRNLINMDRGYLSSTEEPNDVKSVFLYYFHIDLFDISNLYNILVEEYENEIVDLESKDKKYESIIKTEQIKKNEYKFDEIERNIKLIKNNSKEVFYPVYVDFHFEYGSHNKNLLRNLFLADGNHRIVSLKLSGYNGYVPAIVCDYLPYIIE